MRDNTFSKNIAAPTYPLSEVMAIDKTEYKEDRREEVEKAYEEALAILAEEGESVGRRLQRQHNATQEVFKEELCADDDEFCWTADYYKKEVYSVTNPKKPPSTDGGAIYFTCPPEE